MNIREQSLDLDNYVFCFIYAPDGAGLPAFTQISPKNRFLTDPVAIAAAAEDVLAVSQIKKGFQAISQYIINRDAKLGHETTLSKWHERENIRKGLEDYAF